MMGRYKSDVPNTPIREAWEESGISLRELAKRLGKWKRVKGKRIPDDAPVRRALGLMDQRSKGKNYRTTHMRIENAERYAVALELDPVDLGF